MSLMVIYEFYETILPAAQVLYELYEFCSTCMRCCNVLLDRSGVL